MDDVLAGGWIKMASVLKCLFVELERAIDEAGDV